LIQKWFWRPLGLRKSLKTYALLKAKPSLEVYASPNFLKKLKATDLATSDWTN
jgi:hypothetical protein